MKRTFSRSQIICHWLVFLAIVMAYAAMELKGFAPKGSAARATMAAIHYTAGGTVLLLMVGRALLKITHQDPDILPPAPLAKGGVKNHARVAVHDVSRPPVSWSRLPLLWAGDVVILRNNATGSHGSQQKYSAQSEGMA